MTGVPAAARPAGGATIQVDAGDSHTCARGRDGRAYCWGDGSSGQLGNGDVVRHSSPVAVTAPAAGVSFTQLTAGYRQTCGLGSDARAYCWGSNYSGELGNGDNTDRPTPVAVKSPAPGVGFTQLTAGYSHTCGLGGDARAYCWGASSLGELGDGSSTSRSTPVAVKSRVSFTQVSAGISHTCGLGGDARAYCWGVGLSGELGNGDTRIRSTPVAVSAPAPRGDVHPDRRRFQQRVRAGQRRPGLLLGLRRLRSAGRRREQGPVDPGRGAIPGDVHPDQPRCPPHLRAGRRRPGLLLGRRQQRSAGRRRHH
nr:hypothetical protein GCM10020092_024370 [Actinoplanes digitatis]